MEHTNELLYHWGVKGMKWGVRRYQNADGTLTEAGKKRKNNNQANKWVKEDGESAKQIVDSARQISSDTKRLVDNSIKNNPKTKMDLSNMTDKELRDQINRAYMEKQYNELFAPQKSTKGREYASQILETTGIVLAITGSALQIALNMKKLRSGN